MRVAVFVDAGYVFAQGSTTITGLKTPKPRDQLDLNADEIVSRLRKLAGEISRGKELLRIYWYDGAPPSGPSPEQTRLARLNDVKLRLGQLNSEGQQKGVDSLIVTDLVELARNKAIGDALVVTGDEDIRIGLQIAQSLGIRVHLLGIEGPPTRRTQSETLRQEADSNVAWTKSDISALLKVRGQEPVIASRAATTTARPEPVEAKKLAARVSVPIAMNWANLVNQVFEHFATEPTKLQSASAIVKSGKNVPGDIVRILNGKLQEQLNRPPSKTEKGDARLALEKKFKGTS